MQNNCKARLILRELFLGTCNLLRARGHMQTGTVPNLAELSLHICLDTKGDQAIYARRPRR